MKEVRLVATDLDGTFLKNDKSVSRKNLEALEILGHKNIVRVIASGRNLHKVREVVQPEIPFDYIIFSSGAGIFNPRNNEYIFKKNISATTSNGLIGFLKEKDLNFNAFRAVPDNHLLFYFRGSNPCEEFERYFLFHNSFASPLPEAPVTGPLCQFLVILPGNEKLFLELKGELEQQFPEIRVIRSTSPLGTGYIWMEIFHRDVSKGNGLSIICLGLGINPGHTLGIGNDYNDLDLLDFTAFSFIVENAPESLKNKYIPAPSNEDDAFSHVVSRIVCRK